MDSQKQQVAERLKQANNVLVTVKTNPSVDQLAACIGLTIALNKAGKHATAVFSGAIPSTIEFLQPEKTLEKNTNSLQDFIIALDKSKADKLRYKVEDKVVKIFITPYRTSISQDDLQFSQGDFNVDVVLALGVHAQTDLDQAITAHGRILHDATVMTVNVAPGGELGSINWLDAGVSSLSELGVQLVDTLDQKLMDGQIATAFLTGIVAETERFSNQKTSPQTMSISAELMAAGANQQLVASKLEEPAPAPQRPIAETQPKTNDGVGAAPKIGPPVPPKSDDGTIEINHEGEGAPEEPAAPEKPKAPEIHIDEQGRLQPLQPEDKLPPVPPLPPIVKEEGPRLMTEPPTFDASPMTANAEPEKEDSTVNPLSLPDVGLLNREPLSVPNSPPSPVVRPSAVPPAPSVAAQPAPTPVISPQPGPTTGTNFGGTPPVYPPSPPTQPSMPGTNSAPSFTVPNPPAPSWQNPPASSTGGDASKTLSQLEESVHSPHVGSEAPTPAGPPASPGFGSGGTPFTPNPAPSSVIAPQNNTSPATGSTAASGPSVNDARDLVAQAIGSGPDQKLEPIEALNAAPLGSELHPAVSATTGVTSNPSTQPAPQSFGGPPPQTSTDGTTPPPSVPPPMMPLPPNS